MPKAIIYINDVGFELESGKALAVAQSLTEARAMAREDGGAWEADPRLQIGIELNPQYVVLPVAVPSPVKAGS